MVLKKLFKSNIILTLKKVAIIGGNGMLGADLVTYLSPRYSVTAITKTNYQKFIGKTFDVVINANGNSKRFWANQHPSDDFSLSTYSVYNSLFDFTFDKYIYISSSDVYTNHTSPKHTKETASIDVKKLSPYGFHKYLSELIVENNLKDYLILRCSMMIGKNLRKGPIFDILHGTPLFISQKSKLQMITTKEVAEIIHRLLQSKKKNDIINVGGKGTVSVSQIKKKLQKDISFAEKAEKQIYEMNVGKLKRIYPLKTSNEYMVEFVKNFLNNGS